MQKNFCISLFSTDFFGKLVEIKILKYSSMYPLKIQSIQRNTPQSVNITFEVPEELKEFYQFVPGQYLPITYKNEINQWKRSYSVCSSPHEGKLTIGIKEIENGQFSTYANRFLKEGETIWIEKPQGRFVLPENKTFKKVVLFAGGSGITPCLSIIKDILSKNDQTQLVLFYSNREESQIMFASELLELENQFGDRFVVYHYITHSQEAKNLKNVSFGFLDKNELLHLQNIQKLDFREFDKCLICGPEPMVVDYIEFLQSVGIGKEDIVFELFTASTSSFFEEKASESPIFQKTDSSLVKVLIDGQIHQLNLRNDAYPNILEAFLENDIELPHSCKKGSCVSCMCKVTKGEVKMERSFALSQEEKDEGYVLLCQSTAISEEVEVNFDL
ncbi:MAG: flavodoxin reductase [Flavobacteriaceae bacterium]|nr:MAG: flavodoxin reductase [Flavobacteriaceae bacterium]